MKKLSAVLNILTGSFFGVFLARTVFTWLDYRAHPEIYAVWSAPWYTGPLISLILFACVAFVCTGIKFLIRIKNR